MQIQAAVVRAPHAPMRFETLEMAALREDEVLVQLVATGVCHTDIAMRDQVFPVPQPIVLGHEGAGRVLAVGRQVSRVQPGDPVVMSYDFCGHCPSCAAQAHSYCHDFFGANFAGQRPDGSSPLSRAGEPVHGNFFGQSSFASHAICTERNLVPVTAEVPLELLGPLACGLQTGAGAVLNVLRPQPTQSIAVFGTGSVGLAAIMAAKALGVQCIIAIDLLPERLQLARELGASHTLRPSETPDLVAAIRAITGAGLDYSLDTSGAMPVLSQALQALAPRGVCGFVGAAKPGTLLPVDVIDMLTAGKTLRGIVEGDAQARQFIPELIRLYQQGRFPFDRLITFYPFEQLNQALADAESGRTIKPVVLAPSAKQA